MAEKTLISETVARVERWVQTAGVEPGDDEQVRLHKAMLVAFATTVMWAGFAWGAVYVLYGEVLAGTLPIAYSAFSAVTLAHFVLTRRYRFFRTSQLVLILVVPFLLMLALGGYVNGSVVVLWSLLAPFAALLSAGSRQALVFLLGYVLLVVLSALIDPMLDKQTNLPSTLRNIFLVVNIVTVSVTAIAMLRYFMRLRDQALGLLQVEQDRSEALLLNVLPKQVADRLKNDDVDRRSLAESRDEVTVMFADMVGFTTVSASLGPRELVDLLDEVFLYIDDLSDKYGVEKIRTIGDAYMVAAGVPTARSDHADALALMALEIQDFARARSGNGVGEISFRIGMSSGPVVAGIIGSKKFQYDLWGDTVNTASRMESHGVPGRTQITSATRALLADRFLCTPRGAIEVKGKGAMETWFLDGRPDH